MTKAQPKKSTTKPGGKLAKEIAALKAALARSQADLASLKHQHQQQKHQAKTRSQTEILLKLLPVFDNLNRAFAQPPADIKTNSWVSGVLGINKQLQQFFNDLQLEPIKTVGHNFDPQLMEAVATTTDSNLPVNTVVAEILPGYLYCQQVLRVASVQVAVDAPDQTAN